MIVVFDEVYILFHFNIILNTTGCPLLKKKKELVIMITLLWQGVVGIQPEPHAEYHLLSAVCSFLFNICGATKPMFLTGRQLCYLQTENVPNCSKTGHINDVVWDLKWIDDGFFTTVGQILSFTQLCSWRCRALGSVTPRYLTAGVHLNFM